MRPEWVVYKNEQRIGQATTWHKTLSILIEQEKISYFVVNKYTKYIQINNGSQFSYKIRQER